MDAAMTPHRSPQRSSPCQYPPAEVAVPMPTELISEILSRTPLRSVCRFLCVSKEWHTLISHAAFAAAHKSHHPEPLFVVSYLQEDRDMQLMDMDGHDVKSIKGICGRDFNLVSTSQDDLICITNPQRGARVIDPASGEVVADCPKPRPDVPCSFGFGRAIPSGAYKVVCLPIDCTQPHCEVFTLGDCTGWRRSGPPPFHAVCLERYPVVVNGVLYFSITCGHYTGTLLPFDLENEEWKMMIKSPWKGVAPDDSKETTMLRIAELNGSLCMARSERINGCANIWLLENSSRDIWVKAYTIPIALMPYNYTPLRITHDGGKLMFHCTIGGRKVLRVYDPHTESCTTMWEPDGLVDGIGLCNLHLDRFISTKIQCPP